MVLKVMTRRAGIPNKNKRGMKAQLKAQYGKDFDVIMLMGKHCLTLHQIAIKTKAKFDESNETKGVETETADLRHYLATGVEPEKVTQSEVSNTAKTVIDALEKLAQYVEPKLKSIDLSGEVKTWTVIVKDLSGDSDDDEDGEYKASQVWPGDDEELVTVSTDDDDEGELGDA